MPTTVLAVRGMTCQNCVRHVTEALTEVPGVQSVKVDLAAGTATVEHTTATREALVAAVEEAGYEA
ncbi:MAG: heavy-metal-associated domain-containing protein [Candidatus Wallbacteria bacterium]|nr:heavy-metal-associated domain-containing protein [Candidatus Wallbacteria bacterium]